MSPEGRIANAEHSLIGKWSNNSIGVLFNGSDEPDGSGTAYLGDSNLVIFAEAKYKVIIIRQDIYIQFTLNDASSDKKIRDYKIRVIDSVVGELLLESPEGATISLTK